MSVLPRLMAAEPDHDRPKAHRAVMRWILRRSTQLRGSRICGYGQAAGDHAVLGAVRPAGDHVTGLCEIAGAVALVTKPLRWWAGSRSPPMRSASGGQFQARIRRHRTALHRQQLVVSRAAAAFSGPDLVGALWRRGDRLAVAADAWMTTARVADTLGNDSDRRAVLTEFGASDLTTIYPAPSPRVIAKARPEIDAHARKFIAMSPFCVLATSGSDGSVDASPRGGNPGFVHVAGPNRC